VELRKFTDVAIDLDRIYAIQLTYITRRESGNKQIPQLKVYLDIPTSKTDKFYAVTDEQAAERIWEVVKILPKFICAGSWIVDKSKLAWLESKSSRGVFVLSSGRSEEQQLTPEATKAILDSLP
jgi:hypothetical protein